jgi:hypothetical protein
VAHGAVRAVQGCLWCAALKGRVQAHLASYFCSSAFARTGASSVATRHTQTADRSRPNRPCTSCPSIPLAPTTPQGEMSQPCSMTCLGFLLHPHLPQIVIQTQRLVRDAESCSSCAVLKLIQQAAENPLCIRTAQSGPSVATWHTAHRSPSTRSAKPNPLPRISPTTRTTR